MKSPSFTPGSVTNLLWDCGQDAVPLWASVSASVLWEEEQFLPLIIPLEFLRVT